MSWLSTTGVCLHQSGSKSRADPSLLRPSTTVEWGVPTFSNSVGKVVVVDLLDSVCADLCDTDPVIDHQLRQLLSIDKNDPFPYVSHEVFGILRELRGSSQYPRVALKPSRLPANA